MGCKESVRHLCLRRIAAAQRESMERTLITAPFRDKQTSENKEISMETRLKGWQRIALGIGLPAAVFFVCVLLYRGLLNVPCLYYELIGLYCPGCGTGRALKALVHGRIGEAFRCNRMLFILGLPFGSILFHEYLRLVFPGMGLKPVFLAKWVETGTLIVIILYWILRNIPLFSFLAPA